MKDIKYYSGDCNIQYTPNRHCYHCCGTKGLTHHYDDDRPSEFVACKECHGYGVPPIPWCEINNEAQ